MGPTPWSTVAGKPVTLQLQAGAFVSGVVRFDDGTPAANIRVVGGSAYPAVGAQTYEVTRSDGRYRLGPLAGGAVTVSVNVRGRDTSSSGDKPSIRRVVLEAGVEKKDLDFEIGRGGPPIRGMVVDSAGQPVAGASVGAGRERSMTLFFRGSNTVSASDGTFSLEGIPTGPHTVWAIHPDYQDVEASDVPSGAADLRLRLKPGLTVGGVVTSTDGAPVTDYAITQVAGGVPGTADQVRNHDGAFVLSRLRAGTIELQVRTPEGHFGKHDVTLAEGNAPRDLKIVVDTGIQVTGRVTADEGDIPLPNVDVEVSGPTTMIRATTDEKGAFVIKGVPADRPVSLRVSDHLRHIQEFLSVDVPAHARAVDAGTVRLLRGMWADRTTELTSDGLVGLYLRTTNGLTSVFKVRPGLAADRAGLRAGDRIVRVNGRDVRALGGQGVSFLVTGPPGKPVELAVESPGSAGVRFMTMTPGASPPP